MTQPNLKRAARLDTKAVALASLPFMGMISFWQVYDGIVPKMLTGTFGLSNSLTGAIMAIDNVFGLFLLPLFGIFSDRCASNSGVERLYLGRLRGGNALRPAHRDRQQHGQPTSAHWRDYPHAFGNMRLPHHDGCHCGRYYASPTSNQGGLNRKDRRLCGNGSYARRHLGHGSQGRQT